MQKNIPIRIYLGGSFDPVHNSHLALLKHVYITLTNTANHNQVDGTESAEINISACFLPTAQSPLKTNSTDPKHRLAMLKLACDDLTQSYISTLKAKNKLSTKSPHNTLNNHPFSVCEYEIKQPPPSYTIDSLTSLRQSNPKSSIIFIVGADSMAQLSQWKSGDKLTDFAHLWVIPREDLQSSNIITSMLPTSMRAQVTQDLTNLKTKPHGHIYIDSYSVAPYSSSDIRKNIANGKLLLTKTALPPAVYSYIMKKNLYQQ